MVKTLPLSELEKYSENIYEAVMAIAKRARQINEEQKAKMDLPIETEGEYEDYEEEGDKEAEEQKEQRVEELKPTKLALEEMLQGKLRYEYAGKDVMEDTD